MVIISYEVGHAEDPDFPLQYVGTDLSLGANVVADLLGEGKAAVNNVSAEETIFSATGNTILISNTNSQLILDVSAGSLTQGIIDGADALGGTDLLSYYWNAYADPTQPDNPGTPTQVVLLGAPSQLVADLQDIVDAVNSDYFDNKADQLTISQNADLTDSLTMTVHSGSISSYIIDFANYGSIVADTTSGGQVTADETTTSLGTVTTYQEFIYSDGSILKDAYINNNEEIIPATQASEILIGNGAFAGMEAGGSLDTLIDLSGSSSTFDNAGYSSVTEEALNGTTGVSNVFSFGDGTNVLIGDLGNNTFIENPTVTSETNIIWGGGGLSTYSLTGYIDIVETDRTPTSQDIENLSTETSLIAPATFSEYAGALDVYGVAPDVPVLYLTIDNTIITEPTDLYPWDFPPAIPNDFIVDPSADDVLAGFAGTYTPGVVFGFPGQGSVFGVGEGMGYAAYAFTHVSNGILYIASDNIDSSSGYPYSDPFSPEPAYQGDLIIQEISVTGDSSGTVNWEVAPSDEGGTFTSIDGPTVDWPTGSLIGSIEIANFVNGDLGITFSGNTQILGGGSITNEIVDPSDPNSVYNYTDQTTITLGGSPDALRAHGLDVPEAAQQVGSSWSGKSAMQFLRPAQDGALGTVSKHADNDSIFNLASAESVHNSWLLSHSAMPFLQAAQGGGPGAVLTPHLNDSIFGLVASKPSTVGPAGAHHADKRSLFGLPEIDLSARGTTWSPVVTIQP